MGLEMEWHGIELEIGGIGDETGDGMRLGMDRMWDGMGWEGKYDLG
jgi:hypothetical protein